MTTRGVTRNSSFVSWLAAKRKDYKTKEGATHLLLSGGTIRIEPEEESEVLDRLAHDMEHGFSNYVVEMRTPVFRFCQDWDFVYPTELPTEKLLEFLSVQQEVLRAILPDCEGRTMVICSAPIADKQASVEVIVKKLIRGLSHVPIIVEKQTVKQSMVKCGIHTYFPDIFVTQSDAIKIRFILLQAMEQRFPTAFEQRQYIEGTNESSEVQMTRHTIFDTWDKVLDITIYTANGLRMLGSSKASFCCRTTSGDCARCQNRRKIDEGRPYNVIMVVDANAECIESLTQELVANPRKALEYTTIRTRRTEHATLKIPQWFKNIDAMNNKLKQFCGAGRRTTSTATAAIRDEDDLSSPGGWGAPGSSKSMLVNNKPHQFEIIDTKTDIRARKFEQFLRDSVDSGYGRVTLLRMMICCDKGAYRIYAVPTVNYCINVGRRHTGQETYFRYSERGGVIQGCWSSTQGTDRLHGDSCKSDEAKQFFKSKAVKMSKALERAIFEKPSLDLGGPEVLPPAPLDPADGIMDVVGNKELWEKFKSMYIEKRLGSKRKFSWFT